MHRGGRGKWHEAASKSSGRRGRLSGESHRRIEQFETFQTAPLLSSALDISKLVKTEFVFTEIRPSRQVRLCGDWNGWDPIDMHPEQEGIWSVVTVVPSGYREFCYNVDGAFTVSAKHPTNSDGTCNWRTVYGPPSGVQGSIVVGPETHHWFVELALSISDSIRRLLPVSLEPPPDGRHRGSATGLEGCEHDIEVAHGKVKTADLASPRKQGQLWIDKPLKIALLAVAAYAALTLLYIAWNYTNKERM